MLRLPDLNLKGEKANSLDINNILTSEAFPLQFFKRIVCDKKLSKKREIVVVFGLPFYGRFRSKSTPTIAIAMMMAIVAAAIP